MSSNGLQAENRRLSRLLRMERSMREKGLNMIAGVDEAGRGPLAGPVVASAVIFAPETRIAGVDDSKKLTPEHRSALYESIYAAALAVGVGIVDNQEIDRVNILNATFAAMHRALAGLALPPEHVLVDGNRFQCQDYPFTTVVGGDALCFSIAAASIVAKVTRDRIMREYDAVYPGYGFARHKGYATPAHREAILRLGPCAIHRKTFLSNLLGSQEEG